jgi:hypothetical protein
MELSQENCPVTGFGVSSFKCLASATGELGISFTFPHVCYIPHTIVILKIFLPTSLLYLYAKIFMLILICFKTHCSKKE